MAKRKPNGRNIGAAQELKNLVDRIVAVEIERDQAASEFKSEIADLYTEAESNGYDKRALKLAVRRRHESAEQRAKRHETETLADLYAAAIGDLGGKPLDDLTRRRLDEQTPHTADDASSQDELPAEGTEPSGPAETVEAAKERGKQARKDGQRVVDNPYHSASPLRAAWDEGWCEADGSDGMEIPAAWRRGKKPEDEEKQDGEDGEGGEPGGTPPPSESEEQQEQEAQ